MSSEEVFKKYGIKLYRALPMDDSDFLKMLKNCDILPEDCRDKLKTQKTKVDKATYYIQHVIRPSAELYLPKLLQAMEQYYKEYHNDVLQDLLVHVIAEMNSKFNCSLIHKICSLLYILMGITHAMY